MRSLVFQPEEGETEPESRCRVNWDIKLEQLAVPDMQFSRVDGTSDALYAFELALMVMVALVSLELTRLQLEKFVYRKLLDLHALGAGCEDPQFCDEIERYLGDQQDETRPCKVASNFGQTAQS
eukprot:767109-Hanusia_phi.AAC.9